MSTTLTNGLKLPDKGSVDWYSDMQNNYTILDGAVGTVAEHTTALAGKAPAVHTHVTADVTDLLSGNHTWSGSNTFSDHTYIYGQWKGLYFQNPEATAGVSPSGDKRNYIAFLDSNGYILGNITLNVTGANSTWLQTGVSAKDTNDSSQSVYCGTQYRVYGNGEKYFVPATNGDIYLGTSTLQWKSVYAQSYYYNGVAWGLDKENTWSQNQIIASANDKSYCVKDTVYELGQTYPSGEHLSGLTICDKNNDIVGFLDIVDRSYGNTEMRIRVQQKFDPDSNNRSTSGTTLSNELIIGIESDKTNYINFNAELRGANHNLGTSTSKWKTLNGVNPGALSGIDSSVSVAMDTTNWAYNGSWRTLNTASATGWGYIILSNCSANDFISIRYGRTDVNYPCINFHSVLEANSTYYLCALFQVVKNQECRIKILSSGTLLHALFYPCLGNV